MSKNSKYYHVYEDRYRRVYSQGVEYWTGDPEEIGETRSLIEKFLKHYSLYPGKASIIEFGCGEGGIAAYLIKKGYSYRGIDISESALEKARHQAGKPEFSGCFSLGDITDLKDIPSGIFDASIDNYCLHMLVVDSDRQKYLSEIYRILKPGACIYFHENIQKERFEEKIASYEQYLSHFSPDFKTCEEREAYSKGARKKILLPRVPARFNNLAGYREELTQAGFKVEKSDELEYGCVLYGRKRPAKKLSKKSICEFRKRFPINNKIWCNDD